MSTIREWARSQGLTVADRGLIPHAIIDQYKEAHGIGTSEVATTFELLEPAPLTTTWSMSLSAWLDLRDELVALIENDGGSPERIAERILLAGWMRP